MAAGVPIVLTADRSLMAGYTLLFDGMLAASQTTTSPISLLAPLLLPRNRGNAPLGLRRVEAALRSGGFAACDVTVAPEDDLPRVIGPQTRIIGISAGEPGGRGMNSSTMAAVAGGMIWPQSLLNRLIRTITHLRRSAAPDAKVILGGPGSWQVAQDPSLQKRLGIDHVITGYVEGNVAAVFRQLCTGAELPPVIAGEWSAAHPIHSVCGATTMGATEISRGCGLGCSFCTIARTPMVHLPAETVLADIKANLAAGQRNISMLSEDLFRYGATGRSVNPAALISLLQQIRALPGVRLIQADHANIFSLAQYSDDELRTVRKLMGYPGQQYVWINTGIEEIDPDLLRSTGTTAKLHTCRPEDWAAFCHEQLLRLTRVGFMPMASLLLGVSGQTPDHIAATRQWVNQFGNAPVTFFPMLLAPIEQETAAPARQQMHKEHWRLMRDCYRYNFRWLPRMYWDNQKAAGEGVAKRLLLQAMGNGQVVLWKSLFSFHQWRAGV